MNGTGLTLFKLFGFRVRIDPSWIFIALLVAWSLSVGVFPHRVQGLSRGTYWLMGITGAAGLFLSIVFHELCHSLVARRHGLAMEGITLFVFGGIAEMREDPQSPKVEFLMAIAGPLSSIAAALGFYVLYRGAAELGWPEAVSGVLGYLSAINLALAVFNLIPAFPLDGGRVLRSAIWGYSGDLGRATRIASGAGSAFGFLLIMLGVLSVFAGNLLNGLWFVLIGMFIQGAARTSYRRLQVRAALRGDPITRFMTADPITVSPAISLRELVEDFIYRYHHKRFPVVRDGRLAGCISAALVKEIPRERWETTSVGETMEPCVPEGVIGAGADALEALSKMQQGGRTQLLVVEGDRLVGVLSLRDLLGSFELRRELEGE